MKDLKRPILPILALLIAVTLACAPEQLVRRGLVQMQERTIERTATLRDPGRITTVLCGTASPLAQGSTQSCTAIFVNGLFLVFDAGDGAMSSMTQSGLPIGDLDAVFITHFHNDHYADLGEVVELSWILGRRHILPVHGPTGITQIVDGFQSAYELERIYRTAHHGEELMPPEWAPSEAVEFAPPADDTAVVVFEQSDVTVSAFRVSHPPVVPSVGYRIEYAGKSIVISGDTVRTTSLLENSRNADLLVAEVMNMEIVEVMEEVSRELGNTFNAKILVDVRDYHMGVDEVGALAEEADVARLALTHLAPKLPVKRLMKTLYRDPVESIYSGELFVGEDGMEIVISVP
jgi:ribonuclease Z